MTHKEALDEFIAHSPRFKRLSDTEKVAFIFGFFIGRESALPLTPADPLCTECGGELYGETETARGVCADCNEGE